MVEWDNVIWDISKINDEFVIKSGTTKSKSDFKVRGVSFKTIKQYVKQYPNNFYDKITELKEKQAIHNHELYSDWANCKYTTVNSKKED